jgi:hypothetical protein
LFKNNKLCHTAKQQEKTETSGAAKASLLTRETTQVTPVAQEGKPRAKTGSNRQKNSTSDHKADKSGKAAKGFRLGNAPKAAQ